MVWVGEMQLNGMGRGDAARREDGQGDGDEHNNSSEVSSIGKEDAA